MQFSKEFNCASLWRRHQKFLSLAKNEFANEYVRKVSRALSVPTQTMKYSCSNCARWQSHMPKCHRAIQSENEQKCMPYVTHFRLVNVQRMHLRRLHRLLFSRVQHKKSCTSLVPILMDALSSTRADGTAKTVDDKVFSMKINEISWFWNNSRNKRGKYDNLTKNVAKLANDIQFARKLAVRPYALTLLRAANETGGGRVALQI